MSVPSHPGHVLMCAEGGESRGRNLQSWGLEPVVGATSPGAFALIMFAENEPACKCTPNTGFRAIKEHLFLPLTALLLSCWSSLSYLKVGFGR